MIVGVTDHYHAPFHQEARALGDSVEFIDFNSADENNFDEALLSKLDALLVFHARITEKTLSKLDNCKIIVRYGVGVDNIDLEAVKRRGIPLCNTPDYGIEEIAASSVAHILNLWRRISAYDQASRDPDTQWTESLLKPIGRLSEGTLGIVGTGRMGSQVIQYMKPFGCRILGFDKSPSDGTGYEKTSSLKELLGQCDAVSPHCTLSDETAGMVDAEFLAAMKPGALLVNTARGGLFKNLDVLEEALRSGQLGGLGTDVMTSEPPQDHSLIRAWRNFEPWLKGRMVITPHVAYYSDQSIDDMRFKPAETIAAYLNNNGLRNHIA